MDILVSGQLSLPITTVFKKTCLNCHTNRCLYAFPKAAIAQLVDARTISWGSIYTFILFLISYKRTPLVLRSLKRIFKRIFKPINFIPLSFTMILQCMLLQCRISFLMCHELG